MSEQKHLYKKSLIITLFLTAALTITLIQIDSASAKNISSKQQTETLQKISDINNEILYDINKYQEKYFTIIKRNNMLLNFEDSKELRTDRKELKKLFNEVKKQITNKDYLKEYKEIQKRYSKCNGETTTEINEFAQNNYDEIDALLNKVYKDVKSKISPEDFQKLVVSEKKWLKEVKNYKSIYNSMDFGTIGTSTYLDYETNMREFRTLLLMLYL